MSGSTFAWRGKNILKLADVNSDLSRDISLTLMRSPGLLNTPLVHPGNKDNCVYLPVLWWHLFTSLDIHLALEHMAFFVFKRTHFRVRSFWLLRFDVGSAPGQSELHTPGSWKQAQDHACSRTWDQKSITEPLLWGLLEK